MIKGTTHLLSLVSQLCMVILFCNQGLPSVSSFSLKGEFGGGKLRQPLLPTSQMPIRIHIAASKKISLASLRSSVVVKSTDDENNNNNDYIQNESTNQAQQRKRGKFLTAPIKNAISKFKEKPLAYCLIPCIAALVGWFTNYLAVQMIFYPIQYRGLSLYRRLEEPLGFIGWQGIVPCKTRKMSETMVQMVTTQLLSVSEVFYRLDPKKVSDILGPTIPDISEDVIIGVAPHWASKIIHRFPEKMKQSVFVFGMKLFLVKLTQQIQANIKSIFSIRNCVVDQMLADRSLLGKLFYRCGSKELQFLTDSGLWFGFLLGILQMIVALFYDNPWSLSIGGAIVGFATNWLALKWIFEPVNPTKIGPFIFQGLFLKRQKEVAAEFSSFFANKILTSEKVWNSILTDPATLPNFRQLFSNQLLLFVARLTPFRPSEKIVAAVAASTISKLPSKVHVLHGYIDKTLNLQESLRVSMEGMTSAQFERVLHPIFEEDEFTLIIAGAILGFVAGLVQQGIETGTIKIPNIKSVSHAFKRCSGHLITSPGRLFTSLRLLMRKRFKPRDAEDTSGAATAPSTEIRGTDKDDIYPSETKV